MRSERNGNYFLHKNGMFKWQITINLHHPILLPSEAVRQGNFKCREVITINVPLFKKLRDIIFFVGQKLYEPFRETF
jgi:hypothetical protein